MFDPSLTKLSFSIATLLGFSKLFSSVNEAPARVWVSIYLLLASKPVKSSLILRLLLRSTFTSAT